MEVDDFDKGGFAICMVFQKLSYYLYDARVYIKVYHAPLFKFHTTHTSNLKLNNQRTQTGSMSHANFEHIRGTENTLADCTS